MPEILRSFKPVVDSSSRVLILGSMPGPEALRKQQYYGFEGNHFWHIIPKLLKVDRPADYAKRIELVRKNKIALWDVLASCQREGALDSKIRDIQTNPVPKLIKQYPNIKAVFINGKYAYNTFLKHHGEAVNRPVSYLPSSSPANAAMTLHDKVKKWSVILKWIVK